MVVQGNVNDKSLGAMQCTSSVAKSANVKTNDSRYPQCKTSAEAGSVVYSAKVTLSEIILLVQTFHITNNVNPVRRALLK